MSWAERTSQGCGQGLKPEGTHPDICTEPSFSEILKTKAMLEPTRRDVAMGGSRYNPMLQNQLKGKGFELEKEFEAGKMRPPSSYTCLP